jgi:hypothetical protein
MRKSLNKRIRFKGDLARPIQLTVNRPHGFSVPDSRTPEGQAKIRAENEMMLKLIDEAAAKAELEKLNLLLIHFDLEDNDWFGLSLALARAFVPGLQIKHAPIFVNGELFGSGKSGRPLVWDSTRFAELLTDVQSIKDRDGLTDREALARLMRKRKWAPPANHRRGSTKWLETLESLLQDAKREDSKVKELLELLMKCRSENSGNQGTSC